MKSALFYFAYLTVYLALNATPTYSDSDFGAVVESLGKANSGTVGKRLAFLKQRIVNARAYPKSHKPKASDDIATVKPAPSIAVSSYLDAFEVLPEIRTPKKVTPCYVPFAQNKIFANSYGKPSPKYGYAPPKACGTSWQLIILSISVNSMGYQFDRILEVFFDGLEVHRSITVEPDEKGIKWTINLDITRFSSFLKQKRTVTVVLGNIVNSNYTGVYNVTVGAYFFRGALPAQRYADVIIPLGEPNISAFNLINGSQIGSNKVANLPRNAVRASVEILQSHHGRDEFYWQNFPPQYLSKISPQYRPYFTGGGVFRETQVYIDGQLVGATWPAPTIYPGGINPFWWTPVVGIGAFSIPTFVVDVSPFVSKLLDGKAHTISLRVTDVVTGGTWLVSGSLHLWLDGGSKQTSGKLLSYNILPKQNPLVTLSFADPIDANITTTATRSYSASGTISTSFGKLTSKVSSHFTLYNFNSLLYDTALQYNNHLVTLTNNVDITFANGSVFYSKSESIQLPLQVLAYIYVYPDMTNFTVSGQFDHALNFNRSTKYHGISPLTESQTNDQSGGGDYSTVTLSYGYSQQKLKYSSNFQGCFSREYKQNLTVFSLDKVRYRC